MKKHLPLLAVAVFFASGFSSLLYQVVWQRMLTIIYGSGPLSIVIIVSIFLLGLGCGAWLAANSLKRFRFAGRLYAVLELIIALFGLSSPFILQWLDRHSAASPFWITAICVTAFLFIPTLCMGAGLPVLTKAIRFDGMGFFNNLSLLYFINTLGAACGCLCAAFFIIAHLGLDGSVYAASTINFMLAIIAFFSFGPATERSDLSEDAISTAKTSAYTNPSLSTLRLGVLVFISGFIAIAYEIVWFRILSILLKDSAYAFSLMLAMFLLPLAFGSLAVQAFIKKYPRWKEQRLRLYFILQILIALSVAISFLLFQSLAEDGFIEGLVDVNAATTQWPIDASGTELNLLWQNVQFMLWPCLWFMFIPVLFMGASFPLISDEWFSKTADERSAVGYPYFLNVLGNVSGSLLCGFVLLPYLHLSRTVLLLVFAVWLMVFLLIPFVKHASNKFLLIPLLLCCAALFFFLKPFNEFYYLLHRFEKAEQMATFHVTEDKDAVVATYRTEERLKLFINGVGHGENPVLPYIFRAMEAMSWAHHPDTVCIIGLGSGNTLNAICSNPAVKKIFVIEIAEALPKNLESFSYTKRDLDDPRVDLIIDDGRRFLRSTNAKMDVILMDPVRSTAVNSNNIYSLEFFKLCGSRLRNGGVLQCWMDDSTVIPATFSAAFPYVRVYNDMLIGGLSEMNYSGQYRSFQALLMAYPLQAQDYLVGLRASYRYDQTALRNRVKAYPINRGWHPQLEYYLTKKAGH